MARTSKNNRAKKRSLDKSSCDQKENRPKKVHKPNPDDSIAMSKQLLQKKNTTKNNTRAKRQTKSNNRICGNGKIMPTLADLEKMFEDSDDDSDDNPTETNNNKVLEIPVLEIPLSPQEQLPAIINADTLISPSTRTRIKEQVKELLLTIDDSNKHHDKNMDQPPKKRLKFDTHDLDELPCLTTNINTDAITGTYSEPVAQNNNNQLESCQSTFEQILDINREEPVTKKSTENGNSSDNSSESGKTTEYISSPCLNNSQTGSVSQTFCPLPSTSTNNQIFIKNDELFHKSLQEASLNNTKLQDEIKIEASAAMEIPAENILLPDEIKEEQVHNNLNSEITITNEDLLNTTEVQTNTANNKISENEDTDLQIIETPTETILILDDDVKHEPPENTKGVETAIDIEIIDSKNQINLLHDDDDCIFVETQTCSNKPTPTVTDVIDLEYEFIEPSFNGNNSLSNNIDDEIIDVDALIAQNQTILNQYNKPESKNLDSANLVVDVDITIGDYSSNNTNVSTVGQISDVTPENNCNIGNPVINDVSFVSNAVPSTSRTIPDMVRSHRTTTPRRRKKKYNRFYPIVIDNRYGPEEDRNEGFAHETVNYTDRILECVQNFFKNFRPHRNTSANSSSSNLELPDFSLPTNPLSEQIESQTNDYCITELRQSAPPLLSHNNSNRSSSSERTQSTNASVTSTITVSTSVGQVPNTRAPKKKSASVKSNIVPTVITSPAREKPSGSLGDCPICMETLSGNVIASTICGHVFCMRCLQQAIASNKRCPTCRKILNKKNGYHQIYL